MNSDTLSRRESIHFNREEVTEFRKKDRLLLQMLYPPLRSELIPVVDVPVWVGKALSV
jgi:hypothetical protein